jgi:hypothetical protein
MGEECLIEIATAPIQNAFKNSIRARGSERSDATLANCASREAATYRDRSIVEEEPEMHEGSSHRGMSAVINLTARKLT